MRRYRRRPWCVCFDGSKFAETIIADHAIYTDCDQCGLVKNVLFMCLGNVHLCIFILMVQKSCRPAGPSSQMSCRSYAQVVGLGPTDRREFPTLGLDVLTHNNIRFLWKSVKMNNLMPDICSIISTPLFSGLWKICIVSTLIFEKKKWGNAVFRTFFCKKNWWNVQCGHPFLALYSISSQRTVLSIPIPQPSTPPPPPPPPQLL